MGIFFCQGSTNINQKNSLEMLHILKYFFSFLLSYGEPAYEASVAGLLRSTLCLQAFTAIGLRFNLTLLNLEPPFNQTLTCRGPHRFVYYIVSKQPRNAPEKAAS